MVILGIDPGLASMGYGVISYDTVKARMLDCGVLSTTPDYATPQRLRALYEGVRALVERYEPDDIAFEELFFAKNVTTAISVGAARGAALIAAALHTDNLFEYTPMQVKQAVAGYGRADKMQVQQMVKALLGLADIPRPDDAADGLAVAICHAHSARMRHQFAIK